MTDRKSKGLSPDSGDPQKDILKIIGDTLRDGRIPEGLVIMADEETRKNLEVILADISVTQQFALALAQGNLSQDLAVSGHMAGSLKALQSNLRHMTWQAEQIAGGDLSQRVHFMGEFSDSFNAMVEHLFEDKIYRINREDELKRVNAILADEIAERRKTEDALRESREMFRELVENLNDVIISLDLQGNFTYVSPVFGRLYGYETPEMIGQHFSGFIHPDDRLSTIDAFQKRLKGEHGLDEFRIVTNDGRVEHVIISPHPIIRDGIVTGFNYILTNITERKDAEEALKESEQKFREIFNNINDAIELHELRDDGLPGKYLEVNEVTCRMLGYTREELLQHSPLDFTTEYHNRPIDEIGKEIITKGHSRFETGHRNREGTIIPVEINAHVLKHDDKTLVLSVVRDITERRKAEDDLRQSEERFRTLSETSLTGIYIFLDGVIRYANPTFARMYGFTPQEMIGMDPMSLVHPDDRALVRGRMQGRLDHKEEISVYECRMVTRDKRTIHVSIMGALIPFLGRTAISGNLLDITERKKAEEALRESEERYRILFDESPISLWEEDFSDIRYWLGTKKEEGVTDFRTYFETHPEDVMSCVRKVNITRINHASMALFGAHSLQEFSEGLSSVFTPESYDKFREELIAISTGKTWFECEIPLQTVSGKRKIALLKMIVVPGYEQTLKKVVISLLDITERKKMENALRQANKKITMLSSITRHDIKNQLMALRSFLELSQLKTHDPELLVFMKKEEIAAEAITNQIEFTKYYEDIGVNAPEWQDILDLIQTARSQLPVPDSIEVTVDLPPMKVFADGLIEKVFYNLLENTLRHGERVSRIRFFFKEAVSGAEIVYEDNGVGISAKDKSHLFQKGFGKNTGLGLFLSQEILAITGLTIRETGEPGKGVRFVIAVPKDGYRISKE